MFVNLYPWGRLLMIARQLIGGSHGRTTFQVSAKKIHCFLLFVKLVFLRGLRYASEW